MGNKNLYGLIPSSQFGVGGDKCSTKKIVLNANAQPANTTVTLASASTATADVSLTLPDASGMMGLAGTNGFASRYYTVQHWYAATVAGNGNWSNSGAGTAANIALHTAEASKTGSIDLITGTDTGGRVAIGSATTAILFGGRRFIMRGSVAVSALSTGTDRYTLVHGFHNSLSSAAATNGAYFKYNDSNSANWQCITVSASGSTTTTTSSVAATTANQDLMIDVAADGSSAKFYIAGTLVATHTTNIPVAAGETVGQIAGVFKSAGTTSVTATVGPVLLQVEY